MLTLHAILTLTLVKALIASPSPLSDLSPVAVVIDQHGKPLATNDLPSVPEKCDFYCTRMDSPICAGNGQCLQRFQSECAMQAYNCKHPLKPFIIIKDALCEQKWAPLCQSYELGNQ